MSTISVDVLRQLEQERLELKLCPQKTLPVFAQLRFKVLNQNIFKRGAAVAKWICLRLPSCRPRFKSQAHQLRFY